MYGTNFNINWQVYKNWKLWVSLPFMLMILIPLLLLKGLRVIFSAIIDLLELVINAKTPKWVEVWEEWLNDK